MTPSLTRFAQRCVRAPCEDCKRNVSAAAAAKRAFVWRFGYAFGAAALAASVTILRNASVDSFTIASGPVIFT